MAPGEVGAGEPLLATLNGLLVDLGFNEYTTGSTPFLMALFTLSLMIGTAGSGGGGGGGGVPHVIIPLLSLVPKVADARWSAGWALVFIRASVPDGPGRGGHGRA